MQRFLIIEDDEDIFTLIESSLSQTADITWCRSHTQAIGSINKSNYDLVLIDLGLPDGDGFQLCNYINILKPNTPVFIVSGRTSITVKALGFSLEIEDYIEKPFNPLELKIRIESRLKKIKKITAKKKEVIIGLIKIILDAQEVYINKDNQFVHIDLTGIEFKILCLFSKNINKVVSRNQILDEIWGKDIFVSSRVVDSHISKLKRKLSMAGRLISSVRGVGYKLNLKN